MTKGRIIAGSYVGILIIFIAAFGWHHRANNDYHPQEEFKLYTWFSIGPFHVTKAVFYVLLAAILMVWTMVYIAKRMQEKPNRVQTLIELAYTLMRDQVTRPAMSDEMAAKWFPFILSLFLFIWFSNMIGFLPMPTGHEKVNLFGAVKVPAFVLYAATANLSIPLSLSAVVFIAYTASGIRAKGVGGYMKSFIPAGVPKGPMTGFIFVLELMSNFMRLISLSVRLFANILAGHLIILFMGGALVVILGIEVLGVVTFPLAIALFMFEVALVATLQAFIFATLTAIYLGGAVAEHH